MNILSRVLNVALRPAQEWPVIATEPATTAGLYTKYIVPLAAIGPACAFLSALMWGLSEFEGLWMTPPLQWLISYAVVAYVLSLIAVGISALIVEKLAPTFKSQGSFVDALKLVTFSYAPYWLASVITLVPFIRMLASLVGLYGLYLFYVGLPHIMKTPEDQRLPYTGVFVLVAIVVWFVIFGLPSAIVGMMIRMS